jgi:hypothetical protein
LFGAEARGLPIWIRVHENFWVRFFMAFFTLSDKFKACKVGSEPLAIDPFPHCGRNAAFP